MKVVIALLAMLSGGGFALATVLQVGTIEQPVNLGANSDPLRIPLGQVVVESNHGYGIHPVISTARPGTHGALVLEKGLELNMNLASSFGIEVIPEDSTQVPHLPVTLHIKDWPVPSYSPYRKEQVLAATLHCLLRSVRATPKLPLRILIEAENEEDARNLGGFAGDYFTAEANEQGGPTPVPGTQLVTDELGVTYVVLTDGKLPEKTPARRPGPVLIPVRLDNDGEEVSYEALPVWTGDNWKSLRQTIISQPVTLFYDRFDGSTGYGPDINSVTKLQLLFGCKWEQHVVGDRLSLSVRKPASPLPEGLSGALTAVCQTAILSSQPTRKNPLTIQLHVHEDLLRDLQPFTTSEQWKTIDGPADGAIKVLSCTFVWDTRKETLAQGFLPPLRLTRERDRPWMIEFPAHSAPPLVDPDGDLPEEGR